jgi:uncharacterized protein
VLAGEPSAVRHYQPSLTDGGGTQERRESPPGLAENLWQLAKSCSPNRGRKEPNNDTFMKEELDVRAKFDALMEAPLPVLRKLCLLVILIWQATGPVRPDCPLRPSCSRYGYESIQRFGIWRGVLMAGMRITRCNRIRLRELSTRGMSDPVPDRFFITRPNLHEIQHIVRIAALIGASCYAASRLQQGPTRSDRVEGR